MEKRGNSLESEITNVVKIFLEKTKDKEIELISHFDTDGISSAAIMIQTLKKLDKKFSVKIVKRLEEDFIPTLSKNKIGDDVEDENFCLSCVAGCVISSNKTCKLAHKLEYYDGLINELIKRQVDTEKPIYEVIDKIDFIEKKNSDDLFKDVEGMIRGDFKEGEFIRF